MIQLYPYKDEPTFIVGKPACKDALAYHYEYDGAPYRVVVELDFQNVPLIHVYERDDVTVKYTTDTSRNLYQVFGRMEITEQELIDHCNEHLAILADFVFRRCGFQ